MINIQKNNVFSGNDGSNLYGRFAIVIGDKVFVPTDTSLINNDKFENDSITINVPMDLLDISQVYLEARKDNRFIFVEIWYGFLSYNENLAWTHAFESQNYMTNNESYAYLINNYQTLLQKRWTGCVETFKLAFENVDNEDKITILCCDPSKILKNVDFEVTFDGNNSRLENVVKTINKHAASFEFVFGKNVSDKTKNILMGYSKKIQKDGSETEKEIKYVTKGKSYWDILQDVISKGRLKIIPDYSKYYNGKLRYVLDNVESNTKLWKLYREQHFEKAYFTLGKIGQAPSKKVAVKVISAQTIGDQKSVEGTFPKNFTTIENSGNVDEIFYKRISVGLNQTKEYCEEVALNFAKQISQYDVTVELHLPNAIIGIKQGECFQIFDETKNNLSFAKAVRSIQFTIAGNTNQIPTFVITSITEDCNLEDGISQKIEGELDLNYNQGLLNFDTGSLNGKAMLPQTKKVTKKDNENIHSKLLQTFYKQDGLSQ